MQLWISVVAGAQPFTSLQVLVCLLPAHAPVVHCQLGMHGVGELVGLGACVGICTGVGCGVGVGVLAVNGVGVITAATGSDVRLCCVAVSFLKSLSPAIGSETCVT